MSGGFDHNINMLPIKSNTAPPSPENISNLKYHVGLGINSHKNGEHVDGSSAAFSLGLEKNRRVKVS